MSSNLKSIDWVQLSKQVATTNWKWKKRRSNERIRTILHEVLWPKVIETPNELNCFWEQIDEGESW